MIDAERLLGSLVSDALGGRRGRRGRRRRRRGGSLLSGAAKGSLAMGALGVAIGAFEHLTQKKQGGTSPPAPPAAKPPLPPLPPVPGAAPPPVAPAPEPEPAADALLLVRAMIAAANADHELDDEERARILSALEEAEAGPEENGFLLGELESPASLAALAEGATTPELAEQVYLASLMAIDVDTRAERNYLDRLAARLGLAPERAAELEGMLDAPESS